MTRVYEKDIDLICGPWAIPRQSSSHHNVEIKNCLQSPLSQNPSHVPQVLTAEIIDVSHIFMEEKVAIVNCSNLMIISVWKASTLFWCNHVCNFILQIITQLPNALLTLKKSATKVVPSPAAFVKTTRNYKTSFAAIYISTWKEWANSCIKKSEL